MVYISDRAGAAAALKTDPHKILTVEDLVAARTSPEDNPVIVTASEHLNVDMIRRTILSLFNHLDSEDAGVKEEVFKEEHFTLPYNIHLQTGSLHDGKFFYSAQHRIFEPPDYLARGRQFLYPVGNWSLFSENSKKRQTIGINITEYASPDGQNKANCWVTQIDSREAPSEPLRRIAFNGHGRTKEFEFLVAEEFHIRAVIEMLFAEHS